MPIWISDPGARGASAPGPPGIFVSGKDGPAALKERLVARALEEGFAKVGVCAPDAVPEAAGRLAGLLAAGRHGQMGWMAERAAWRGSPAALWPEARSVVMLAESLYAGGRSAGGAGGSGTGGRSASMRRARITTIWSSGG